MCVNSLEGAGRHFGMTPDSKHLKLDEALVAEKPSETVGLDGLVEADVVPLSLNLFIDPMNQRLVVGF